MHSTEHLRNIEESLSRHIADVDDDFDVALQSLLDARGRGDQEIPDTYPVLHAKKCVYSAVSGVLYAQDVIDLEYRMEMIRKLAERGVNMVMVPVVTTIDECVKNAWQEVLEFFDEEEEWLTFSSKILR